MNRVLAFAAVLLVSSCAWTNATDHEASTSNDPDGQGAQMLASAGYWIAAATSASAVSCDCECGTSCGALNGLSCQSTCGCAGDRSCADSETTGCGGACDCKCGAACGAGNAACVTGCDCACSKGGCGGECAAPVLDAAAAIDEAWFGACPEHAATSLQQWFESGQMPVVKVLPPQKGYYRLHDSDETSFAWVVTASVQGEDTDHTYHCWFRGEELVAVFDPTRTPAVGVSAALD